MSEPTDYTDPSTIDVDEVIANIIHAHRQRGDKWDNAVCWPNVTVLALAQEIVTLRREMEFAEILCDGGQILVNSVPWREMFDRINSIVSDPVRPRRSARAAVSTSAVMLEILDERRRQVEVHGRTEEHDDTHTPQEWGWLVLKRATDLCMPWPEAHLDSRRELVEIAAIACAAVEALDRTAAKAAIMLPHSEYPPADSTGAPTP